ncbi:MAG: hypothetical protein QM772_07015 [Ottowia sp.]|uniref:hypothetical protein n=1 Tax=Ottowia sp. TaxID=1898956 RepID=UPI0039E62930
MNKVHARSKPVAKESVQPRKYKVPNAETRAAMAEADAMILARAARLAGPGPASSGGGNEESFRPCRF